MSPDGVLHWKFGAGLTAGQKCYKLRGMQYWSLVKDVKGNSVANETQGTNSSFVVEAEHKGANGPWATEFGGVIDCTGIKLNVVLHLDDGAFDGAWS